MTRVVVARGILVPAVQYARSVLLHSGEQSFGPSVCNDVSAWKGCRGLPGASSRPSSYAAAALSVERLLTVEYLKHAPSAMKPPSFMRPVLSLASSSVFPEPGVGCSLSNLRCSRSKVMLASTDARRHLFGDLPCPEVDLVNYSGY